MNIPELRYITNPFLLKYLEDKNKDLRKEDLEKFKEKAEYYKKYILETISKLIGCGWVEKDINIYLTSPKRRGPSKAFPLILKLRKNPYLNLYFLTHELVHRFFCLCDPRSFANEFHPKKDREEKEAMTDFLTRKVIRKLFGRRTAEKLKEKEQKIVTSRYLEKCEKIIEKYERKYDLDKKTLLDYWKQRN